MNIPELVRYPLIVLSRVVDGHGQQECPVGRHQLGSINRELPLETEISLVALVRVPRNDRDKQHAGLDLLADRLIPHISATQCALVEPDLDPGRTQRFANPYRRLSVLGA